MSPEDQFSLTRRYYNELKRFGVTPEAVKAVLDAERAELNGDGTDKNPGLIKIRERVSAGFAKALEEIKAPPPTTPIVPHVGRVRIIRTGEEMSFTSFASDGIQPAYKLGGTWYYHHELG